MILLVTLSSLLTLVMPEFCLCGQGRTVIQGRVEVDYGSLYYEESGTGEPLILIHDDTLSNSMWDEQFYELSQSYRVVRYDLRGCGASSPCAEYVQFTHAGDLLTLMNALSIEKAHLVGFSLGGAIGADMLGWFPDRLLSAVLVGGNVRKQPGPSQLSYLEVCPLGGLDAYEKLQENAPDVPVLLIEGRETGDDNRSGSLEILNYLPAGKSIRLDNCGLSPDMVQPEVFNQTLLDFLHQLKQKSGSTKQVRNRKVKIKR